MNTPDIPRTERNEFEEPLLEIELDSGYEVRLRQRFLFKDIPTGDTPEEGIAARREARKHAFVQEWNEAEKTFREDGMRAVNAHIEYLEDELQRLQDSEDLERWERHKHIRASVAQNARECVWDEEGEEEIGAAVKEEPFSEMTIPREWTWSRVVEEAEREQEGYRERIEKHRQKLSNIEFELDVYQLLRDIEQEGRQKPVKVVEAGTDAAVLREQIREHKKRLPIPERETRKRNTLVAWALVDDYRDGTEVERGTLQDCLADELGTDKKDPLRGVETNVLNPYGHERAEDLYRSLRLVTCAYGLRRGWDTVEEVVQAWTGDDLDAKSCVGLAALNTAELQDLHRATSHL